MPSTKSSRSSELKLEAKAILACIPSTVRAGIAAIRDHSRRRRSLSSSPRAVKLRQADRLVVATRAKSGGH